MLHGLESAMRGVLPSSDTFLALLGIAAVAALLSNIVNNLPAVLVLLPLVTVSGPPAVLAMLLGVNIGPNLTYVGSLANLCGAASSAWTSPRGFANSARSG
jgi:arsenical pump membrane protein